MTNPEERLFMLDLAIVQLISGILVTLGSTLLAISIGFGLTIPEAMRDALLQSLVTRTELSPELQQSILQQSLSNYVFVLAIVSTVLIATGVLFASVKTAKIRKEIKAARAVAKLLNSDIRANPPEDNARHLQNQT
jgi:hypothetical protein